MYVSTWARIIARIMAGRAGDPSKALMDVETMILSVKGDGYRETHEVFPVLNEVRSALIELEQRREEAEERMASSQESRWPGQRRWQGHPYYFHE